MGLRILRVASDDATKDPKTAWLPKHRETGTVISAPRLQREAVAPFLTAA